MLEVVELLEPAELLKCMIAEVFPELLDAFGCDTGAEVLCIGVSCDALASGSEGLPKMPLSSRCSSGQWPSVAKHRKAGADDFMAGGFFGCAHCQSLPPLQSFKASSR